MQLLPCVCPMQLQQDGFQCISQCLFDNKDNETKKGTFQALQRPSEFEDFEALHFLRDQRVGQAASDSPLPVLDLVSLGSLTSAKSFVRGFAQ